MNRRKVRWVVLFVAVAAIPAAAFVWFHYFARPNSAILDFGPGVSTQATILRGTIDADMTKRVSDSIARGVSHFIIADCPGGSFLQASVMAGLINANFGSLTATGDCESACALMLMGVHNKFYTAGAGVGVHGAYYRHAGFGQNQEQPFQETVSYMVANGVPAPLAEKWGTSFNIHMLTPDELAAIGITPVSLR